MRAVKKYSKSPIVILTLGLSSFFLPIPIFATNIPHQVTSPVAHHSESQLKIYRSNYYQLNEILKNSQSPKDDEQIDDLLKSMENYELYPFAKYKWLLKKTNLTLQDITQLQKQLPSYIPITTIKQHWLNQQAKLKNWSMIYANRAILPKNIYSQCLLLQSQQKLNNQLTPAIVDAINKLWMTGDSLPTSCDQLLDIWIKTGHLSNQHILQRGELAFQKYNQSLLRNLIKQSKNIKTQQRLTQYLQLVQDPMQLLNKKSTSNVMRLMRHPEQNKKIMITIFPRFVRSLPTAQLPQGVSFGTFKLWANKFKLTDIEKKTWQKLLVQHFFDSSNSMIIAWRDRSLVELKNDALFERRIRYALRNNQNPLFWIKSLSPSTQQKSEWLFWHGACLLKYENNRNKTHEIWSKLTKYRGYYPMLSAQMLGLAYNPPMEHLKSNTLSFTPQQEKDLAIISELQHMQENHFAAVAWANLLSTMSQHEKLKMAQYAEKQKWYDLQVEATILAKAWGYLPLRLPNAYISLFDFYLKDKSIQRTFAMAVARQESAWRPQVKSHANAYGLMQIIPSTAKYIAKKQKLNYTNIQQLFEPKTNIMLGVHYLEELYKKYDNNRILAAVAYNAGQGRLDKWLEKSNGKLTMAEFIASIPFRETRNYVENVLTYDYYHQILQNQLLQKFTQNEYSRKY